MPDYEAYVYDFLKRNASLGTLDSLGRRVEIDLKSGRALAELLEQYETAIVNVGGDLKKLEYKLGHIKDLSAFQQYQSSRFDQFRNIIVRNAEKAFKLNLDLDIPEWREHLYDLLRSPEILTIVPYFKDVAGTQLKTFDYVTVEINSWQVLGRLSDYGNAVTAARTKLDYGKKIYGKLASRIWYDRLWMAGRGDESIELAKTQKRKGKKPLSEKVRKLRSEHKTLLESKYESLKAKKNFKDLNALYWNIMDTRLQEMANKAPYWYLLEYGAASMSSDKGGYAAPPIVPTRFIHNSEIQIKSQIESYFGNKPDIDPDISEQIEHTKRRIEELKQVVISLKELIRLNFDEPIKFAFDRLKIQLAGVLESIKKSRSISARANLKIKLLANQILAGIAPGRVYIGTFEGKVYRPRITELIRSVIEDSKKNDIDLITKNEDRTRVAQKAIEVLEAKLIKNRNLRNMEIKRLKELEAEELKKDKPSRESLSAIKKLIDAATKGVIKK